MTAAASQPMTPIAGCRSCGDKGIETVLQLGQVPLANRLLTAAELKQPEPRFPLTLAFCPACSLLQIRETVAPEILFAHYLYFSSFSDTMLAHAKEETETLTKRLQLNKHSLVVEVASNDGYLLKNFVANGIPVLGIDPAENIAKQANAAGVPTLAEFFGKALAERLVREGRRADVIIGNNVLAHVADLNGFVAGVGMLLKDAGSAVFEFPYGGEMIRNVEFDTIYHEHLCYFSLTAIVALFARHGMTVNDVERHAIHGGSLRVYAQPQAKAARPSRAVTALLAEEKSAGMTGAGYYRDFAKRVDGIKQALLKELRARKKKGQTLAAYGASAKGSTLINYFGIGGDLLDFIADRSSVKQGHYAPGAHLPIVAPAALIEKKPDACVLLTWNFAEEIFRQQADYLRGGGQFIVPIPTVRTVGQEVLK